MPRWRHGAPPSNVWRRFTAPSWRPAPPPATACRSRRPPASDLALEDVTLALPGGEALMSHASLAFPRPSVGADQRPLRVRQVDAVPRHRRHLAVRQRHGRAGRRPPALFLPQRPYIPLGTLAPRGALSRRPGGVRRCGRSRGAGATSGWADWRAGSTRRITGRSACPAASSSAWRWRARCCCEPDWLFLDEATASLDATAEAQLYQLHQGALPNTTVISISHHEAVAPFHDRRLTLRRDTDLPGTLLAAE